MTPFLSKLVLPELVTEFESRYLRRMNRISLMFFALHVPVFTLVAFLNHTKPVWAAILTTAVLIGPALAYLALSNLRMVSVVYGVTAMFMGGLLVHFGQGPLQIEMHFYFFALIAMLAVYGNPMVIVAAAATVALHHLILWFALPSSVFNYEAPVWVVAVHAAFVVLESVATCFIARSFFDNVIGLERIVQKRTAELDGRNRDMRLVLDNVRQGLLTIDREGRLSAEYSSVVCAWLGTPVPGMTLADLVAQKAPEFAARIELGWTDVIANILPIELTLAQMPTLLKLEDRYLRFDYLPIGRTDEIDQALVRISDVTSEIQQARTELERRQSMAVFEHMSADRAGFLEFLDESTAIVEAVTGRMESDPVALKRMIHTLKGNCSVFGVESVAELCHEMETRFIEESLPPVAEQIEQLSKAWSRLRDDVDRIVGFRRNLIELDEAQYRGLLEAAAGSTERATLVRMLEELAMEPTRVRLERIGEQARRIAKRLTKGDLDLRVEDHDMRLDPKRWSTFWSAFIHAVRNSVDHGIEPAAERRAAGKAERGRVSLRTYAAGNTLVVEIEDDGRGIDWSRLAERAKNLGLPTASEKDLHEALFQDGVSTAAQISEVSGRGIGMGAVRAAAQRLGGDIVVHTNPGSGTRIEVRFPLGGRIEPALSKPGVAAA